MNLVEFVSPVKHPLWTLCKQMGIEDVIIKVNPALTGLPDPWRFETLSKIVAGLKAEGLNVVGLEGDPFDMAPIKEYGARPYMDESRTAALAHYCELLESMARLGIKLLCYNFMVGPGWSRTGVRKVRGGALATYFSLKESSEFSVQSSESKDVRSKSEEVRSLESKAQAQSPRKLALCENGRACRPATAACGEVVRNQEPEPSNLILDKSQVWSNYTYFIKSVMPTAERLGIRMGLHPDDPCLPSLGGYARIFETVEDYDRAYAIYPCESNAVTYCQANFKLMGADLIETAKHFGKRIAFIHFRDVEGDKYDFTELFHDQGTTDQFALMRTYREIGLDVPVRGDHVPEMEGDRKITEDATPGYFCLGRLFANGYLKALLAYGEKCEIKKWST